MKKLLSTTLPLVASILLLLLIGLSIRAYRNSFAPGAYTDPAKPRLQSPVTIRIAKTDLPPLPNNQKATFLLEVVKEHSAAFSTHYWPNGETVLSIPVLSGQNGIRLRLSLWDAGTYLIRLRDSLGAKTVLSFPVVVRTPLRLYRNDLVLAGIIGLLAWGSGLFARGIAPNESQLFSLAGRRSFFPALFAAGILLIVFSSWTPGEKELGGKIQKTVSAVPGSTQETEGRNGVHPVLLFSENQRLQPQEGLLFIRHRLDSWSDYGRVATLFEGRVSRELHSRAFLLLPDDGRYNLTLWSPETDQSRPGNLSRTKWSLRAFPSSPPFPKALFTGLALFSIAFFIKGISYNPRSKDPLSKTWGEVS